MGPDCTFPRMPRIGTAVPAAYRVSITRVETHDTVTLELEPDGEEVTGFAPGQFAMLYVLGVGEVPISVSGEVMSPGRLVHTVRAVGATTAALCAMRPGDAVGVRGPFGRGWPLAGAEGRDVVVIAGGLGLAPLRPVVGHVLTHRERFGELTVLYGARTPAGVLYRGDLGRWRERLGTALEVTVDAADPSWRGRVGVVTTLVGSATFDPGSATAMLCGPEVMMRFTVAALRERGLTDANIHVSLERSMACAVGHCGRCQLGPALVCRDGPVFRHDVVKPLLDVRGL